MSKNKKIESRCPKCGIEVREYTEKCPLCGAKIRSLGYGPFGVFADIFRWIGEWIIAVRGLLRELFWWWY